MWNDASCDPWLTGALRTQESGDEEEELDAAVDVIAGGRGSVQC